MTSDKGFLGETNTEPESKEQLKLLKCFLSESLDEYLQESEVREMKY